MSKGAGFPGERCGRARPTRPGPGSGGVDEAVVQDSNGSADVLEVKDIAKPVPTDDEVLVRVHAAGVDPGVWHLMTGRPYLVRVMGYGLRTPKVGVRGRDVAGRVEAVGTNVAQVQAGAEVFGSARAPLPST